MFLAIFVWGNRFHVKHVSNSFDVIVVGGGHAGIEAALAVSRLDKTCCVLTMDKLAVGRMSCNPAIGGQAKGKWFVKLTPWGAVMGLAADRSGLQFKILNRSKGKAVWSPRAQVDKRTYEQYVNAYLYSSNRIKVVVGEAVSLQIKNNSVEGVLLRGGGKIFARSVVLTCGTFLNGLVHVGERKIVAGRMGERGAKGITESLGFVGFF
jgi:tRNA uridine 5-carboxymethylaminomethyl modification enzyme